MKNKKVQQLIGLFSASVRKYILLEYKSAYYDIYADVDITRDVRTLIVEYYWGGNNVPFTAGQVVDYVRSKYKKKK
jgi:hypothetical protein